MKPVMAYYYLTIRCNSKCSYCDFWKMKPTEEPTVDQLKQNIDSLSRLGIKYIDFTGGEPFLYKYIQTALDIAKGENKMYGIFYDCIGVLIFIRKDRKVKKGYIRYLLRRRDV
jgi:MoaA/NifB/PqqE/SkfB family radical SAM enzyme